MQPAYPAQPARIPQGIATPPANLQWAGENTNRPTAAPSVVRAKVDDPPAPPSRLTLRLPPPEDLGIPAGKGASGETSFDQRLQSLGVTGLKVEPSGQGRYRAHFQLPGARAVEAEGASHDSAVNLALDRAELSLRR
jgi:hypothetical protein